MLNTALGEVSVNFLFNFRKRRPSPLGADRRSLKTETFRRISREVVCARQLFSYSFWSNQSTYLRGGKKSLRAVKPGRGNIARNYAEKSFRMFVLGAVRLRLITEKNPFTPQLRAWNENRDRGPPFAIKHVVQIVKRSFRS